MRPEESQGVDDLSPTPQWVRDSMPPLPPGPPRAPRAPSSSHTHHTHALPHAVAPMHMAPTHRATHGQPHVDIPSGRSTAFHAQPTHLHHSDARYALTHPAGGLSGRCRLGGGRRCVDVGRGRGGGSGGGGFVVGGGGGVSTRLDRPMIGQGNRMHAIDLLFPEIPPATATQIRVDGSIGASTLWSGHLEGEAARRPFPADPVRGHVVSAGVLDVGDGGASRAGPRPIWRV